MTAETAFTEPTQIEEIMGSVDNRLLVDDIECEVGRLKTREFFALMRVLTRGMGGQVVSLFEAGLPTEELGARFVGALLMSLPQAENDFLLLMKQMVRPVDPAMAEPLKAALDNPELEVLMQVAETIALQEAGELTRLGKAARSWWEVNKDQLTQQV